MKVKEILDKANVEYRLLKLKNKPRTVQAVMEHNPDVKVKLICKTIIMRDKKKNYIAIFIKGSDLIDKNKVKEIIGKKVSLATHDDVMKAARVEPGCVCPLLVNVPMIIDKDVLKLDTLNCGSGEFDYELEIKLENLLKLLKNYRIEDVKK